MPMYDYECKNCGERFEVSHGLREEPKLVCDACGGLAKRTMSFTSGGFHVVLGEGFSRDVARKKEAKVLAASSEPEGGHHHNEVDSSECHQHTHHGPSCCMHYDIDAMIRAIDEEDASQT